MTSETTPATNVTIKKKKKNGMPKTEPSHLINFSFRPTIIVFNGCDQEWHPTTEQTKNVPSVQDSMELFTP